MKTITMAALLLTAMASGVLAESYQYNQTDVQRHQAEIDRQTATRHEQEIINQRLENINREMKYGLDGRTNLDRPTGSARAD